MTTILDEIVESKRRQLADQKNDMPLESLKRTLQPSDRDFAAALRSPSPAFILECKKASPSKGLIRSDFDLPSIAKTYHRFASAISVLTEQEYFQGSLSNLGIVRQNARQPILCKDFFVEPYQVYQARHFGADAILLILAILTDEQWHQLYDLAKSLGMDAITEVSNEQEARRAVALQAPIVGINNRDLRDMSVNLETTRILQAQLPSDRIVISESGYYTNSQIRSMQDCCDGFLVGSSLMSELRLGVAVKKLLFGEHKICGLTRNDDAQQADVAGAVYGGVIFAESSPRKVTVKQVEQIFAGTDLVRVGVFQDHDNETIVQTQRETQIEVIQLHGSEPLSLITEIRSRTHAESVQVWKALTVEELVASGQQWLDAGTDRLLVDTRVNGQSGGTGQCFDWSKIPEAMRLHLIVAGGIGDENVASAVQLGCCGVDMNSRLETEPGRKSPEKIDRAFQNIRSA